MKASQPDRTDEALARARLLAWIAAGATFVVGILVVFVGIGVDDRSIDPTTSTTSATAPTPPPAPDAGAPSENETGTEESLLDRAFTPGTLVLVRFGIVVLAAFLAGAAVQRVVLGRFAIKIGSFEIVEVETDPAVAALKAEVKTSIGETQTSLLKLATTVKADLEALRRETRASPRQRPLRKRAAQGSGRRPGKR